MSTGQPPRRKPGLPTWAGILAFLTAVGTILGVVTGIIALVQFGQQAVGGNQGNSPDQQHIYETLAAVQVANGQLGIQLTQYAVAGQQAANDATSNAINIQAANVQGTISALQAQQDALVATSQAQSAMTAAADSVNATATQNALDAGATAAAIAGIVPTPTDLPTPTPPPAQVSDYRQLLDAASTYDQNGRLQMSVTTANAIPDNPQVGLSYVWMVDTDRNPATGLAVQDIGVDLTMSARYDNGAWLGTGRSILVDGSEGPPIVFTDIIVAGNQVIATVNPADFGLVGIFDWVARSESDQETYPILPALSHYTIQ